MNLKVVNFYSTPEAQAWRLFSSSQLHCPFTENLKTVPNGGLWERHSPVKNPILLILQCECVCLCIWIQYPGRPKVSDPLEVEFQAGQLWAVSTGVRNWMKSGPFEKQFQTSTSETLLQSQNLFCCCLFVCLFWFLWGEEGIFQKSEIVITYVHRPSILKALRKTCNTIYKKMHDLSLREHQATPKFGSHALCKDRARP